MRHKNKKRKRKRTRKRTRKRERKNGGNKGSVCLLLASGGGKHEREEEEQMGQSDIGNKRGSIHLQLQQQAWAGRQKRRTKTIANGNKHLHKQTNKQTNDNNKRDMMGMIGIGGHVPHACPSRC